MAQSNRRLRILANCSFGFGCHLGRAWLFKVYLLSSGASGLLSHMYEFASLLGMFVVAYLFMQVCGAFHHLIQAQRRT